MVQSGRRPRLSCRVQKECGLALSPACSAGGKFAGEKLPVDVEERLPYSDSKKKEVGIILAAQSGCCPAYISAIKTSCAMLSVYPATPNARGLLTTT